MYIYWILALTYLQSLWAAEVGLSVDSREIFVGIPFELSVIAKDFEESPEPKVEPFDLQYKPRYDLVLDRVTHWYHISREWIKKITLMDDVYVLNNPWAIQSMEKHTSYCAMMRLGMKVPTTWMLPPKEHLRDLFSPRLVVP